MRNFWWKRTFKRELITFSLCGWFLTFLWGTDSRRVRIFVKFYFCVKIIKKYFGQSSTTKWIFFLCEKAAEKNFAYLFLKSEEKVLSKMKLLSCLNDVAETASEVDFREMLIQKMKLWQVLSYNFILMFSQGLAGLKFACFVEEFCDLNEIEGSVFARLFWTRL